MKIDASIIFIIAGGYLLSLSSVIFADISTANTTKSYSEKSSLSNKALQKPVITNEAEYEEFVKNNEGVNRVDPVKSASFQTSNHATVSVVSSSTSSNRAKKSTK